VEAFVLEKELSWLAREIVQKGKLIAGNEVLKDDGCGGGSGAGGAAPREFCAAASGFSAPPAIGSNVRKTTAETKLHFRDEPGRTHRMTSRIQSN